MPQPHKGSAYKAQMASIVPWKGPFLNGGVKNGSVTAPEFQVEGLGSVLAETGRLGSEMFLLPLDGPELKHIKTILART